jgi:hypothetical protein
LFAGGYKSSWCLSIIKVDSGGKVVFWGLTLSVIVRQKVCMYMCLIVSSYRYWVTLVSQTYFCLWGWMKIEV